MNLKRNIKPSSIVKLREIINYRLQCLNNRTHNQGLIDQQNNLIKSMLHKIIRPVIKKHNIPAGIEIYEESLNVNIPIRNMSAEAITTNIQIKYKYNINNMQEKDMNKFLNDIDECITSYKTSNDTLVSKNKEIIPDIEPIVTIEAKTKYFK